MNSKEVRQKLVDDGVAGARVFRNTAPKGTTTPFIVIRVSQTPLTPDLRSNDSFKNTFDFSVYGDNFGQAKAAQLELRESLRLVGRELVCQEDEYPDPDTGELRILNVWNTAEFG